MSTNVKCLACDYVFLRSLEMCPRRYISPHDEEAMKDATLSRAMLMLRLLHAQFDLIRDRDERLQDLLGKVKTFIGPEDGEQWEDLLWQAKEKI